MFENWLFFIIAKSEKHNCSARNEKSGACCPDSLKDAPLAKLAAANSLATVTEREIPSSGLKWCVEAFLFL